MKSIGIILMCMLFAGLCFGQSIKITGDVVDETNNILPGVNIYVKGTKHGTITDLNGRFTITVKDTINTVLVVSFIGYEKQEIPLKSAKHLNISLKPSGQKLEEVVVVGYSSVKKSDLTGSVSIVKSERIGAPMGVKIRGKVSGVSGKKRRICGVLSSPAENTPVYMNPSIEEYAKIHENGFKLVRNNPLSTFSADVDNASYSNIRRFINYGQKPPADAVRIEEMINYFDYEYPQPENGRPITIYTEKSQCPWEKKHQLLHIGIQGKDIDKENLPNSNLVFLIDVSGSMSSANKLPLLKSAYRLLVNNLRKEDRVAIVVYAGAAGTALKSTPGNKRRDILSAINNLSAGGSTAGGEGIKLAYKIAKENYIPGGNNRIILATDGDFNVGVSNNNELEDLITAKRESGIFLTCLGFGMGNYKDSKLETLANKGNGNYAYIDNIHEANKFLVKEFGGSLFTIAKDVKLQIEFNPAFVQAYRLVGYENRLLNDEDFKDDTKDAGEMGAGHTVTVLYEIIPKGVESQFIKEIDDLKYQTIRTNPKETGQEVATVKCRYKEPEGKKSRQIVHTILETDLSPEETTDKYCFSASVAMFGMLLRDSEYKGNSSYQKVISLASSGKGKDENGYRSEFIRLVKSMESFAGL
jgi:Ca-activated chloride channel homolog